MYPQPGERLRELGTNTEPLLAKLVTKLYSTKKNSEK
jgi:hypothetical protein